jgi:hypothetical protein
MYVGLEINKIEGNEINTTKAYIVNDGIESSDVVTE